MPFNRYLSLFRKVYTDDALYLLYGLHLTLILAMSWKRLKAMKAVEKLEINYKELQMKNGKNNTKNREKVNLHLWRTVIKKQVIKYSKNGQILLNDANDGMQRTMDKINKINLKLLVFMFIMQ